MALPVPPGHEPCPPALIEQHRSGLAELCRRFGVRRLYVFGSAASDRLQPSSDVDFVVDMVDRQPTGSDANRYLDFGDALEHLLGRRVDLVTEHAMRNPYFRREVEATRRLVSPSHLPARVAEVEALLD